MGTKTDAPLPGQHIREHSPLIVAPTTELSCTVFQDTTSGEGSASTLSCPKNGDQIGRAHDVDQVRTLTANNPCNTMPFSADTPNPPHTAVEPTFTSSVLHRPVRRLLSAVETCISTFGTSESSMDIDSDSTSSTISLTPVTPIVPFSFPSGGGRPPTLRKIMEGLPKEIDDLLRFRTARRILRTSNPVTVPSAHHMAKLSDAARSYVERGLFVARKKKKARPGRREREARRASKDLSRI